MTPLFTLEGELKEMEKKQKQSKSKFFFYCLVTATISLQQLGEDSKRISHKSTAQILN
jgi:hypothetical protein